MKSCLITKGSKVITSLDSFKMKEDTPVDFLYESLGDVAVLYDGVICIVRKPSVKFFDEFEDFQQSKIED